MTRLALLTPARNAEDVLPRLLESARAQTSAFDEVIVYDDASSDATGEVARKYGASVVRTEVNTGPSAGKNLLAARTACEWIHFHDADDALGPEFVERARRWMDRGEADVILFHTEERADETGRPLGQARWDAAALARDPVAYNLRQTVTNCALYRRDRFLAAGGFETDEAIKYNEDQALHLRLALAGLRFGVEPYVGVITYRRANSMSSGHPIECARAQVNVLIRAAGQVGPKYATEIGSRLWRLAAVCAGHLDWQYVKKSLDLARSIGYTDPELEHWGIRLIARVSPLGAIRAREEFIRMLKPHLRAGLPTVRPVPAADRP